MARPTSSLARSASTGCWDPLATPCPTTSLAHIDNPKAGQNSKPASPGFTWVFLPHSFSRFTNNAAHSTRLQS